MFSHAGIYCYGFYSKLNLCLVTTSLHWTCELDINTTRLNVRPITQPTHVSLHSFHPHEWCRNVVRSCQISLHWSAHTGYKSRVIITGPPNWPVLFCWLSSVVVVCNAAGGRRARGRPKLHSGPVVLRPVQGRIKASAGPGAVPNAGPLQTYNQVTTPTNCGPQNCGAAPLAPPLMRHWSR